MKPREKTLYFRCVQYTCKSKQEYDQLKSQAFETQMVMDGIAAVDNNHLKAMKLVRHVWTQPVFREDLCMVENPARLRNAVHNPPVNTLGLEEPFGFNWRANKGSTTNVNTSCATKRGENNGDR